MPKQTIAKKETELAAALMRPPVVVVMGHIDHGKTTLLDWYRKSRVAATESGGITQHVGAYEVLYAGKKLTFIDTPGHEAFAGIRTRGAGVADIAILVVAADEGVKPQTKETIAIIKKQNLPFVVAINKTDRPEANEERVKQELAAEEVLVESYGGQIPSVAVSAKTGEQMDDLLEILLLIAELQQLVAHPESPAEGVVLESRLDPRRGISATLLIRDGTMRRGDTILIGRAIETVRIFENFVGKPITEAGPSAPVILAGLAAPVSVGESFKQCSDKVAAEAFIRLLPAEISGARERGAAAKEGEEIFNLILKADVAGSLEAIESSIKKLEREELRIRILKTGVGDVSESDVKFARATESVTIVGFKVRVDAAVRELAEHGRVRVITGDIIYDVLDQTKLAMESMIAPVVTRVTLGRARILRVFRKDGNRQIVGGKIEEGVARRGAKADILRNRHVADTGTIVQLQRNRQDADEVPAGSEFGMMLEAREAIQEGDILEIFTE